MLASKSFRLMAAHVAEDYGSELIYADDNPNELIGFICPHCGDPIWYDDWEDYFNEDNCYCPICEESLID